MKMIVALGIGSLVAAFSTEAAAQKKKDDKPDAVAFLKKFDTNNDAKLDITELSMGLKSLAQNNVTTKNDSWKKFDADNDGKISLTELKKLLEESSREKVDPVAFMEKFDTSKDAKLDTFELSAGFKTLKPTALMAKSDFWKKFDANHDNKINAKELEALIEEYNK